MRVLILAEECNPDWPSVPMFAYQAVRAISDYAEVVLVTQIRNAQHIERAGMGRARVVYINTEKVARPLWKLSVALRRGTETGWLLADALAYPGQIAFEWLAVKHLGGRCSVGSSTWSIACHPGTVFTLGGCPRTPVFPG